MSEDQPPQAPKPPRINPALRNALIIIAAIVVAYLVIHAIQQHEAYQRCVALIGDTSGICKAEYGGLGERVYRRGRRGDPLGEHHEDIIRMLKMRYPDIRTTRFAAEMRKLTDGYEVTVPRIIPDAWTVVPHPVDDRMQVFRVWEVEIASPLDRAKLITYGRLWGDLDGSDAMVDLALVVADRHGTEKPVDLTPFYYLAIMRKDQ